MKHFCDKIDDLTFDFRCWDLIQGLSAVSQGHLKFNQGYYRRENTNYVLAENPA